MTANLFNLLLFGTLCTFFGGEIVIAFTLALERNERFYKHLMVMLVLVLVMCGVAFDMGAEGLLKR
jgi:hypothetical protein